MLDPGYCKWCADRAWKKGFSLFADGTEQEINRVSFQMSIRKEIVRSTAKYKGNLIHLLYVSSLDFPQLPSPYYYSILDEKDGQYMRMSDARNVAICGVI